MNHIKRFFTDKDGKVAVLQVPNAPLGAWFIFLLVSKAMPPGDWRSWTSAISTVSLLCWAMLEIGWGASYFRQLLGVTVFSLVIVHRF